MAVSDVLNLRCQINNWIYTYFLRTNQYILKNEIAINNRKWLLKKNINSKNNSKEKIGNREIKCSVGRDILCSIEQIQRNIGNNFKIEYSKKHLYTEHLFSASFLKPQTLLKIYIKKECTTRTGGMDLVYACFLCDMMQ